MIKVFEAFAGIGTQRMALRNLGIEHEVVAIAEIDKFAIKSYEAIHGKTHNVGDISKVQADDIPDHDLFTYSFPCTNVSIAGKQGGLKKGSGTQSSLLWECNRVIESKKPKYLMLENVKNLVGKKFKPDFEKWLEHLEGLGYTNYWQILNAKDYGVPQNRERVFVISILGEHEPYVFPEKFELTSRLKDVLEDEVDEKFYLSEEKTKKLTLNMEKDKKGEINVADKLNHFVYRSMDEVLSPDGASTALNTMGGGDRQPKIVDTNIIGHLNTSNYEQSDRVYNIDKAAPTISARDYKGAKQILEPKIAASRGRDNGQQLEYNKQGTSNSLTTVQKDNYVVENLGNVNPSGRGMNGNVYSSEGVSPTLTTNKGEGSKIAIKNATKKGYLLAENGDGIDLAYPDSKTRRGRVQKQRSQTVTTSDNLGVVEGISDKFSFVKKRSTEIIDKYGDLPEMYNPYNKSKITDISPTITTSSNRASSSGQVLLNNNFRIRKLTPKECWRLMGCSDDDFHKAEEVNSNTQLYKQAGNAIVVDVLEQLFRQLFR